MAGIPGWTAETLHSATGQQARSTTMEAALSYIGSWQNPTFGDRGGNDGLVPIQVVPSALFRPPARPIYADEWTSGFEQRPISAE